MKARWLLIIAAAGEFATGAALLLVPSLPIRLLLGEELAAPVPVVVARITGAALVAIGIICWLAKDASSRGRPDVMVGLLVYNLAVATILIHAATAYGIHGIALWTMVLLHLLLALWCIACLPSGDSLARGAGNERR